MANDDRIDLAARTVPPDVGIDDIEQVYAYGVLYAARALWEELGIGPLLRAKMQQNGCQAPHDMALLAMTVHRLARPGSKLACDEQWLADDVYWPEAHALVLEHLYRALDFLERQGFAHKIKSLNAYVACRQGPDAHAAAFLICDCCGATARTTSTCARPGSARATT